MMVSGWRGGLLVRSFAAQGVRSQRPCTPIIAIGQQTQLVDICSYAQTQCSMYTKHLHLTVVPDDEVFRVKLRKSNTLRFFGSCNLEILR